MKNASINSARTEYGKRKQLIDVSDCPDPRAFRLAQRERKKRKARIRANSSFLLFLLTPFALSLVEGLLRAVSPPERFDKSARTDRENKMRM
jgi:hypothetical protein